MQEYVKNNTLRVLVKPNANKTEIIGFDTARNALKIAVAAQPEHNKANMELLKFVQKTLHKKAEFTSGLTAKLKVLRILE